jgi:hypothetical protein
MAGVGLPEVRRGQSGRPPKLTPEIAEKFFETLRATGNQNAAAGRIGVDPKTVIAWRNRGAAQTRGIYREFHNQCLKLRAAVVVADAEKHHRLSVGGIIRKPKVVVVTTEKGAECRTTQIQRNAAGEIEWEEHWQEPDKGALEWELSRLDPETYAVKPDVPVNQTTNIISIDIARELIERAPAAVASREAVDITHEPAILLPQDETTSPEQFSVDDILRFRAD